MKKTTNAIDVLMARTTRNAPAAAAALTKLSPPAKAKKPNDDDDFLNAAIRAGALDDDDDDDDDDPPAAPKKRAPTTATRRRPPPASESAAASNKRRKHAPVNTTATVEKPVPITLIRPPSPTPKAPAFPLVEMQMELPVLLFEDPVCQMESMVEKHLEEQQRLGFKSIFFSIHTPALKKFFAEIFLPLIKAHLPKQSTNLLLHHHLLAHGYEQYFANDRPDSAFFIFTAVTAVRGTSPGATHYYIPMSTYINAMCVLLDPRSGDDEENTRRKQWRESITEVIMIPDFILSMVFILPPDYLFDLFPSLNKEESPWIFNDTRYVQQSIVRPAFQGVTFRLSMLFFQLGQLFMEIRNDFVIPEQFHSSNMLLATLVAICDAVFTPATQLEKAVETVQKYFLLNPRVAVYITRMEAFLKSIAASPSTYDSSADINAATDAVAVRNLVDKCDDLHVATTSVCRFISNSASNKIGTASKTKRKIRLGVDRVLVLKKMEGTGIKKKVYFDLIEKCFGAVGGGEKRARKQYSDLLAQLPPRAVKAGDLELSEEEEFNKHYELVLTSILVRHPDVNALSAPHDPLEVLLKDNVQRPITKETSIMFAHHMFSFLPKSFFSQSWTFQQAVANLMSPAQLPVQEGVGLMIFPFLTSVYAFHQNGWADVMNVIIYMFTNNLSEAKGRVQPIEEGPEAAAQRALFGSSLPQVMFNFISAAERYHQGSDGDITKAVRNIILAMGTHLPVMLDNSGKGTDKWAFLKLMEDHTEITNASLQQLWAELCKTFLTSNCAIASQFLFTASYCLLPQSEDETTPELPFNEFLQFVLHISFSAQCMPPPADMHKELHPIILRNSYPFIHTPLIAESDKPVDSVQLDFAFNFTPVDEATKKERQHSHFAAMMRAFCAIECEYRHINLGYCFLLLEYCLDVFEKQWHSNAQVMHPLFKMFGNVEWISKRFVAPQFDLAGDVTPGTPLQDKYTDLVFHNECFVALHDASLADAELDEAQIVKNQQNKVHLPGTPWYGVSPPLAHYLCKIDADKTRNSFVDFLEMPNKYKQSEIEKQEYNGADFQKLVNALHWDMDEMQNWNDCFKQMGILQE